VTWAYSRGGKATGRVCDGCLDQEADRNYASHRISGCVLKWEINCWGRDLQDVTLVHSQGQNMHVVYACIVYTVARFVRSVIINEKLFGFDIFHRVK
jgi:hypothetical protein